MRRLFDKMLTAAAKIKPVGEFITHNGATFNALREFTFDKEHMARLQSQELAQMERAALGGNAIKVAPEHAQAIDDKLGMRGKKLMQNYERILNHPLCRKFLKKKPSLFITPHSDVEGAAHSEALITLSEKLVIELHPKEASAILAHEVGHILRGDSKTNPWTPLLNSLNTESEKAADTLGVMLSGNAEALKSGLDKISHFSGESRRQQQKGSRNYPSLEKRFAHIDSIATALADRKKSGQLLADMNDYLEARNPSHRR